MKRHLSMRLPEDIIEHISGMAKEEDLSTTAAVKKMLREAMSMGDSVEAGDPSPDLENVLSSIDELKGLLHESTQTNRGNPDGLDGLARRIERIESTLAKLPDGTSKVLSEVAKVGKRIDALKSVQPATPQPVATTARAKPIQKQKKASKRVSLYRERDGGLQMDKREAERNVPAYKERRAGALAKALWADWKSLGRSERALASKLELSQRDLTDLVEGKLAVDPDGGLLGRIDRIHGSITPHVLKA